MKAEERVAQFAAKLASELEESEHDREILKRQLNDLIAKGRAGNCNECGELKVLCWEDAKAGKICAGCLRDITTRRCLDKSEELFETEIPSD